MVARPGGGPYHAPVQTAGLFLQPGLDQAQGELQAFLWTPRPDEHHFYLRGLRHSEICGLYAAGMAAAHVLVTAFDPDLLAPEFWEPYARETEEALRRSPGGAITRLSDGVRKIWRADRAKAAGRLLAKDPGAPVSLLRGRVLSGPGSFVGSLGDPPGLLEWAAYDALPADTEGFALQVQADVDAFRAGATRPRYLVSVDPSGGTRVIFSSRADFRAAVNAALGGYLSSLCQDRVAPLSHRTIDQLAAAVDGVGFTSSPLGDFVDKGRTFEIHARLDGTRWGLRRPDVLEAYGDEDARILIYYDRVSGIWEVVS